MFIPAQERLKILLDFAGKEFAQRGRDQACLQFRRVLERAQHAKKSLVQVGDEKIGVER
jgi:hypothetical protein